MSCTEDPSAKLPSLYLSLVWFYIRIIMKKSGKLWNYLVINHL